MSKLSVSKKIGIEDNVESLFKCRSCCNFCGKKIPSEAIFIDGFSYLIKYCDCCKEGKYRRLICKGKLETPKKFYKSGNSYSFLENKNNLEDKFSSRKGICFHLTYECNTFCKICPNIADHEEKNEYKLSTKFIKDSLKSKKIKGKYIILFGGEPTVRKDLPKIIRIVKNSGNIPVITTNGIRIGEDIEYLRKLKRNGLRHIHLSFDGFSKDIYSKLRNSENASFLLKKKFAALKNLNEENMKVMLQTTLAGGVNTGELIKIMDYIASNDSIYQLELKSLSLLGEEEKFGFTKESLLSANEINELICGALGINPQYLGLYGKLVYELKKNPFFKTILYSLLNLDYPVFSENKIYLKRDNNRLKPLLDIKEIKTLLSLVKEKKIAKIFNVKWHKLLLPLLKFLLYPGVLEDKFHKSGIVRVSQAMFINDKDVILHPSYNPVNIEVVPNPSLHIYPNIFGAIYVVPLE